MSSQSAKNLIYVSALFTAFALISLTAHAETSDLDSALNNSLQESREITQNLYPKLANDLSAPTETLKAGKLREEVQINFDFDESDTKKTSNYSDVTDIVER